MREAQAGAWAMEKGRWQVITTATAYEAAERFNNIGLRNDQPTYTKQEISPYVEYGVNDWLTVGGSVFLQRLDDSSDITTGMGDSEIFARAQVWKNERYVVSLQPMIKIPSPQGQTTRSPAIGSEDADLGLSALGGMNFRLFGRTHFAEVSAGYRYRLGDPHDQLVGSATLGFNVTDRISILPQLFETFRLGYDTTPNFTQSPRDDYILTKAQLSAVYKLTDTDAIQVGGFTHVYGRNASAGGGLLLAYWKSF